MKRRFFSKMIASLPLLLTLPRRALAAPVSSMKEIEELQKSWKTLLADGADIAASAAPLNRPNTEWKKTLSPAAYGAQEHMGRVEDRLAPALPHQTVHAVFPHIMWCTT